MGMRYKVLMSPVVSGLGLFKLGNAPSPPPPLTSACNARDLGSTPGSGRSPGEGNGYPRQYSCLENPLDREASWALIHGIAKSWTQLSD